MSTGRAAFGFLSAVFLASALVTYFTQPRDGAPIVVPYVLAALGFVAIAAAWYVGRYPLRIGDRLDGYDETHNTSHIDRDD